MGSVMDFSVTEASLAGFRVVGRRPLSALVWALVWMVFAYGGLALLFMYAAPSFQAALSGVPHPGDDPKHAMMAVFQLEMTLVRLIWPFALLMWLVAVVLQAAVFRAVIEPRKRGFAYLRLGGDELRLAVLSIVLVILWIIYCVALSLAGGAAIAASAHLEQPWRGLAVAAVVIVAICLTITILVRLSLAAPMTFARKRLQIFDSWGVTSGRFWALVGVILMIAILAIAISIGLGLIRNALLLGTMQQMVRDMMEHPGDPGPVLSRIFQMLDPRNLTPMMAAALVVQGLGGTLLRVVVAAPFAETYRVLTSTPETPAAPTGGALVLDPEPDGHGHAATVAHDAHGHDDHGHADPHAHADDHAHDDSHGHDDHGQDDHGHGGGDHGHGDDHGQGHGDDHGHGDGHGDDDDHGHGGHGH